MPIERNPDWDAETTDAEFETLASAAIATSTRSAEDIFKAAAPSAAQEIVNLSLNAVNERVKLDASKYVIDRVMGRVTDRGVMGDGDGTAPWADIYATTVIREPAASARAQGAPVVRSRLQPYPSDDND